MSSMRPEKIAAILADMLDLGIEDRDIEEKFILGSGRGGQKVNKTHNCVYLKYLPLAAEIRCQASRSRELNRWLARRALCAEVRARREGRPARRLTVVRMRRD